MLEASTHGTPLAAAADWLDRPAVLGDDAIWSWREVHEAALELARPPRRRHRGVQSLRLPPRLPGDAAGGAAPRLPVDPAAFRRQCRARRSRRRRPRNEGGRRPASLARALVRRSLSAVPAGARASAAPRPGRARLDAGLGRGRDPSLHLRQHRRPASPAEDARPARARGPALVARLAEDIEGGVATLDRIVCSVPPQHMFGLECSVMLSLVCGLPVLDRRPLLPADVRAAFEGGPRPLWVATPMHLRSLVQERRGGARVRPGDRLDDAARTRDRPRRRTLPRRAGARDLRLHRDRRAGDAAHLRGSHVAPARRRAARAGHRKHDRPWPALRLPGRGSRRDRALRRRPVHPARPARRPGEDRRPPSLPRRPRPAAARSARHRGRRVLPARRPAARPSGSASSTPARRSTATRRWAGCASAWTRSSCRAPSSASNACRATRAASCGAPRSPASTRHGSRRRRTLPRRSAPRCRSYVAPS